LTYHDLARDSLAAFCVVQGAATIALDLNRTHASHPQWPGHARFHVVWQTATIAALSIFEVIVLFFRGASHPQRFFFVLVLAAAPVFGFFAAFLTRSIYGGTLSDPGGIPPLNVRIGTRTLRIDLNLATEVIAVAFLTALYFTYRAG
jgi:hypothetical protein